VADESGITAVNPWFAVSIITTSSQFTHGFQTSVYDYITKLCRKQAVVLQNHKNENIRNIGQGELRHRNCKRLKLGGGQATTVHVTRLLLSGATNDRA
jgi:hypothetical protein